ncbi:hypothetical protein [Vagococcus silagei]|uniref:Uncharacterized protein n=1 Tax=Vagococcus silagei TaxID=2508885 RepID=A0A4S3B5H2_9ENTE|nr:hypothetical protein [Vagococcus silagei]THB62122.1 hypothetical protein ESZ54_02635 [Vagococcus silagei]
MVFFISSFILLAVLVILTYRKSVDSMTTATDRTTPRDVSIEKLLSRKRMNKLEGNWCSLSKSEELYIEKEDDTQIIFRKASIDNPSQLLTFHHAHENWIDFVTDDELTLYRFVFLSNGYISLTMNANREYYEHNQLEFQPVTTEAVEYRRVNDK